MIVLDDWLLTPARAAIHLPSATGVIADVHLGYAEARRRNGDAVPKRTVVTVLAPLHGVLSAHGVRRLVVAGDLFEAGPRTDLIAELQEGLSACGIDLIAVVPGNHDAGVTACNRLPVWQDGFDLGDWRIVHGDAPLPPGKIIQGHEHPCFRQGRLQAPCYLIGPDRLILPAFSPDAAGFNVLGDRRWGRYRLGVIVGDEVLDFGLAEKVRDRIQASRT